MSNTGETLVFAKTLSELRARHDALNSSICSLEQAMIHIFEMGPAALTADYFFCRSAVEMVQTMLEELNVPAKLDAMIELPGDEGRVKLVGLYSETFAAVHMDLESIGTGLFEVCAQAIAGFEGLIGSAANRLNVVLANVYGKAWKF